MIQIPKSVSGLINPICLDSILSHLTVFIAYSNGILISGQTSPQNSDKERETSRAYIGCLNKTGDIAFSQTVGVLLSQSDGYNERWRRVISSAKPRQRIIDASLYTRHMLGALLK